MSEEVKYEFSQEENGMIEALIKNLWAFLPPLILFSMAEAVATLFLYLKMDSDWGPALYPFSGLVVVVSICFAILIKNAASDFQLIVDTEGSDIEHLLEALGKVRRSLMLASTVVFGLTILFVGALSQALKVILS